MNFPKTNYEFSPIGGSAGQAHLAILKQFAGNNEIVLDVFTSALRVKLELISRPMAATKKD
jgi:hypothetical protein